MISVKLSASFWAHGSSQEMAATIVVIILECIASIDAPA